MNAVGPMLVVFVLAAVLMLTGSVTVNSTLEATRRQTVISQTEQDYATALDSTLSAMATSYAANPSAALTVPFTSWSSGSASATIASEGLAEFSAANGTQDTAANLNTRVDEQRIALLIAVKHDANSTPVEHKVIVRFWDVSPYFQVLSDQVIGNTTDNAVRAAAEVGGCGQNLGSFANADTSGNGCDTSAPQAADPSIIQSYKQCLPTVGSGTCPSGPGIPDAAYTNKTWTNNQTNVVP